MFTSSLTGSKSRRALLIIRQLPVIRTREGADGRLYTGENASTHQHITNVRLTLTHSQEKTYYTPPTSLKHFHFDSENPFQLFIFDVRVAQLIVKRSQFKHPCNLIPKVEKGIG